MNVQQLIDHLETYPRDMEVWVARDAEGNARHALYTIEMETLDDEGEVVWNEDEENTELEPNALVLYP